MHNPDLPKLLRAIGHTQTSDIGIIHFQAAIELEKLEKIYQIIDDNTQAQFAVNPGRILSEVIAALDKV